MEISSINDTRVLTLPLQPYNDWAVAIAARPVTNKQYRNFLKNVKSEILDEIIYHHVAEKVNMSGPKSHFAEPVGLVNEHGIWKEGFHPFDDAAYNSPGSPVVCVSVIDALGYVSWLNSILNFSGIIFTMVNDELWLQANSLSLAGGDVMEWGAPRPRQPSADDEEQIMASVKKSDGHLFSSSALSQGIMAKQAGLGFRVAALVSTKSFSPELKAEAFTDTGTAAPFVDDYFNRSYRYY